MESKKDVMHTPEPWGFTDHGVGEVCVYAENDQNCIASLDADDSYSWGGKTVCEHMANARRIVACVNACKGIDSNNAIFMKGNGVRSVIVASEKKCIDLEAQRDQAVRALKSAGYTLADGAKEWKPPVGPSASPLLDRIDELAAQRDELLALTRESANWLREIVDCEEEADLLERLDAAITKCEVKS